jgi:DNA polymerase-3 subunit beta
VLEPGKSVLVSAKALSELQRLVADGSLQVGFGTADASFQLGTTTILSRLIMGQFPAYQKLIPQNQPNRLVLDREALADAIRRVKTVAQGRDDIAVRIAMESGRIEITATAADVGEARDELDADFTGEDTTVAFNPDFLLDGISAIDAERVVIETTDGMKPAVIKGENVSDFLYLLMPVRV